jgi:hypothetical protein
MTTKTKSEFILSRPCPGNNEIEIATLFRQFETGRKGPTNFNLTVYLISKEHKQHIHILSMDEVLKYPSEFASQIMGSQWINNNDYKIRLDPFWTKYLDDLRENYIVAKVMCE